MYMLNLRKYGVLSKNMGINPNNEFHEVGDETVGTFGMDAHHKNVYLPAKDVDIMTEGPTEVNLTEDIVVDGYNYVLLELSMEARILGVMANSLILKKGDSLRLLANTDDVDVASKILELPWLIKASVIRGTKK